MVEQMDDDIHLHLGTYIQVQELVEEIRILHHKFIKAKDSPLVAWIVAGKGA
jgi:hypothetical protein